MKENRQAVTHEAGEFIRRNLRDFPSPLSGELFKISRNLKRYTTSHLLLKCTSPLPASMDTKQSDYTGKGNRSRIV